jgi:hypothetical protein
MGGQQLLTGQLHTLQGSSGWFWSAPGIVFPRYPPYQASLPLSATWGGTQWEASNSSRANFIHYKAVVAGFGPPRVLYFPGTHHIWRALPYPPRGEGPDGRPPTPHGISRLIVLK